MTNLANVLKDEIGRYVQKEIRLQMRETVKAVARYQRDITALQRQVEELKGKRTQAQTGKGGNKQPDKKATEQASGKTAKQVSQTTDDASGKSASKKTKAASSAGEAKNRPHFSMKKLKAHREHLGLSADVYGKLVGVSGLSIYNWEQEKARPRGSSVEALIQISKVGKREALKRLKEMTPAS